jgi:hypothetical protein
MFPTITDKAGMTGNWHFFFNPFSGKIQRRHMASERERAPD